MTFSPLGISLLSSVLRRLRREPPHRLLWDERLRHSSLPEPTAMLPDRNPHYLQLQMLPHQVELSLLLPYEKQQLLVVLAKPIYSAQRNRKNLGRRKLLPRLTSKLRRRRPKKKRNALRSLDTTLRQKKQR